MKRLACGMAGLALLAVGVAVAADPSIKDIMTRAHKGSKSLLATINTELRQDEPDWGDVQKDSKELVDLGKSLAKNEPPRGDKESWERLTTSYEASAQALEAAAESKNKPGAKSALGKIQGSCKACHTAHRKK